MLSIPLILVNKPIPRSHWVKVLISLGNFPAKTKPLWQWVNMMQWIRGRTGARAADRRRGCLGWLLIVAISHVADVTGFWRALSTNARPYTHFAAQNIGFPPRTHTHTETLYHHHIHTFLYICQISWYWMGKMTNLRGFSRSSGSSEGSKGAADLSMMVADLPVEFSASSLATWPVSSWPMDILRTLLALSVKTFLLGLCVYAGREGGKENINFFAA